MNSDARQELMRRIERVRTKKMSSEADLYVLQLEAECCRHSDDILTARDLYSQAADRLLTLGLPLGKIRYQDLLLEAATVLKQSGPVAANLKKAVKYLEAIGPFATQDLRVFATLAEMYAMLGNEERYRIFYEKARAKLESDGDSLSYRTREAAENALSRAEACIGRRG